MKPAYVADLAPDQTITSFFLVCEKELRSTREGKAYLRLELSDRTGSIEARMWHRFEDSAAICRDDIVKVQARVEAYRNRMQLALDRLRLAEPAEVDLSDYFACTKEDVEKLYAELQDCAASIPNPWLRRLAEDVLNDPAIAVKLKRAPAAKIMHHAYLGGLLEHVVSLCGLCKVVAAHYPETDAGFLIAGAILHDIGKIDELSYERSLGYTTSGQLLGHIVMEIETVSKRIDAIPNFPTELKTLIQHMLISHHGQYAFGSPKLPMFREALLLHYLDDLDSKMAAMRAAFASDKGDGEWTERSSALDRRLLRVEEYLKQGVGSPEETVQRSLNLTSDGESYQTGPVKK
ncbi:MAG TPA: OB-fold nucleic acid binding domain-containing protein [Candidatus Dormibacteraeota bacterium]|nr:OB-fold nucleic acid binding domain-containing protein [Candidatus Dormibacteraeota bacterium]